jgi:predicted DNA-binding transcriptional regulator AlpA
MESTANTTASDAALITAEQLAGTLQVSKRTLWRMRSAGQLPRCVRRRDEVAAWIAAGCPAVPDAK